MAYIGKRPEDALRGNASYNAFTGDGSTTTFDVTNLLPDGGAFDVEVFVDNVRQEAGASKSYTIGQDGSGDLKRITFNVAPDDGSEIYVINPGRTTATITVNDNTISAAKIQADAVTTAKITDSNVTAAKLASSLDLSSKTITLPNTSVTNAQLAGSIANAKLANSSITINGTAVSLGGSVTAGTDWQAVVVADGSTQLTAVAGRGYFLDTNLGTIDVILPTSPSRGDTIVLADYGNNFATNRVIINTGGKLIDSVVGGEPGTGGFTLDTNGAVVELVFADDTAGWIVKQNSAPSDLGAEQYSTTIEATGGTVTTSGNFKMHTFTGDGNFIVTHAGRGTDAAPSVVDYLVVAGGGGGGAEMGGGGGAGGFRTSKATDCLPAPQTSPLASPAGITLTAQTYPITVGAGGASPGSPGSAAGDNGSNSVFSTITSTGGGGAAASGAPTAGKAGGSGGGGGGGPSGGTAGSGNTPPVSPAQGTNGGTGAGGGSSEAGGGGGGAATAGSNAATGSSGGNGGNGSYVFGSTFGGCNGVPGPVSGARFFAGGGGGGGAANVSTRGLGGEGGGGAGIAPPTSPSTSVAGTANTGSGGGGQKNSGGAGGAGGKGIVILRYKFQ